MNTRTMIGIAAVAAAIVAGVIIYLQGFDAEKVACEDIDGARASLQTAYESGVNASVQVYADTKAHIDEQLHQCLSASPKDPCADAQAARDAAANQYMNGTPSPAENAPYSEWQTYFGKRDKDYDSYKKAKDSLDQCRAANPPKTDVPYEQSDTKKCFDAYDTATEAARDTFSKDTQAMKAALKATLVALDAREKACHPPTGADKFTQPPTTGGTSEGGTGTGATDAALMNCKMINPNLDIELFLLQRRAAAIPAEIAAVQTSIDNANKRMGPLRRDLADVGTYIPPESTKTQYEGALNGIRSERKTALETDLAFYQGIVERKQAEKAELQQELSDLNAQIAARIAQINKENEARKRAFPTALHQAKPDKCSYYHCHGMLCGKQDPDPHGCGFGSTTQGDTSCSQFIDAYLKAAGVH